MRSASVAVQISVEMDAAEDGSSPEPLGRWVQWGLLCCFHNGGVHVLSREPHIVRSRFSTAASVLRSRDPQQRCRGSLAGLLQASSIVTKSAKGSNGSNPRERNRTVHQGPAIVRIGTPHLKRRPVSRIQHARFGQQL